MIVVNSILLAIYDYDPLAVDSGPNVFVDTCGSVFTAIFTLEAVIKIIAMGFVVHRNSYLRDPWNNLDFVVVISGLIELLGPKSPPGDGGLDTGNEGGAHLELKALRTLRVLRPLRSINAFPSMRKLVGSLLASLPNLASVVAFMFFIFMIFGILSVH